MWQQVHSCRERPACGCRRRFFDSDRPKRNRQRELRVRSPSLPFRFSLISWLDHILVTSSKRISNLTRGTASSSSSPRFSPSRPSLLQKARSHSSQHQRHSSRAPSRSRSPSCRPNGKSSRAQRVSNRSGATGKYGMRSARRGCRAGAGRAKIKARRRSGCMRFPLTPVGPFFHSHIYISLCLEWPY